ncbi:MAG: FliI/YscN family ATPase [Acidiferrobacterales bacterium]|nr:FliI/YscN family ATPase [Acidiferrobacterales bacterium]
MGKVKTVPVLKTYGSVQEVSGTQIRATLPGARVGDLCEIDSAILQQSILAEVVGFKNGETVLASLNSPEGIAYNDRIVPLRSKHRIIASDDMYGRVYDGMGRDLATKGIGIFAKNTAATDQSATPVIAEAVAATEKIRICDAMPTGIKVIDGLLTIGEGQRLGLFAGAGCGKTTLMACLARGCDADAIVFSLVGERGRELKEFLDHELDDELKARSILVCATSDRSSMERSRAAFTATAIAEGLRNQGKRVLLLVDSLTRFARAQREIGLAAGEPPAKGGFPPSVYTMLPKLIERAGKTPQGSITAIYTLLLEGDSMADPIGDEAKSLLDGHIVLSRKLAEKGHYPAVDVLKSLSRTMTNVVESEQMKFASEIRSLLSRYEEMELLIRLGEYQPGNDPFTDKAVTINDSINKFLQQGLRDQHTFEEIVDMMREFQ